MDGPACIADRSARRRRPHRHVISRLLLSLVALMNFPACNGAPQHAGDLVILRPSERRPRDFASTSNVTVVVPAIRENVARALPRLLGSIDGQRLVPAETILVLSGAGEAACKPALRALKQHLHRSALTLICSPEGVNQAKARNIGIRFASARWVSFIDADDTMWPDRLAALASAAERFPSLQLFLHGWSEAERRPSTSERQLMADTRLTAGAALYDAARASAGQHAWVLAGVMHSQASVRRDVLERGVAFRVEPEFHRIEDSTFVRDVISHIGRRDEAMLFADYPLGWHVPHAQQQQQPSPSTAAGEVRATIVTAYFSVPSKHTDEVYASWMANMLSLDEPMVIFTTHDNASAVRRMRVHALDRTHIIMMPLRKTFMATNFPQVRRRLYATSHGSVALWRAARHRCRCAHSASTPACRAQVVHESEPANARGNRSSRFWARQRLLDPESAIHRSVEVYWIWDEKAQFLKRAADLNPFDSTFFAWVDIGYFRTASYNGKRMIRHLPSSLRAGQVLLLNVSSLVEGKPFVGGGFIGGDSQAIGRWNTSFYATLARAASRGLFVGKDQPWMYRTCLDTPGLCVMVMPQRCASQDPWFWMSPYLHEGPDKRCQLPPLTARGRVLSEAHHTAVRRTAMHHIAPKTKLDKATRAHRVCMIVPVYSVHFVHLRKRLQLTYELSVGTVTPTTVVVFDDNEAQDSFCAASAAECRHPNVTLLSLRRLLGDAEYATARAMFTSDTEPRLNPPSSKCERRTVGRNYQSLKKFYGALYAPAHCDNYWVSDSESWPFRDYDWAAVVAPNIRGDVAVQVVVSWNQDATCQFEDDAYTDASCAQLVERHLGLEGYFDSPPHERKLFHTRFDLNNWWFYSRRAVAALVDRVLGRYTSFVDFWVNLRIEATAVWTQFAQHLAAAPHAPIRVRNFVDEVRAAFPRAARACCRCPPCATLQDLFSACFLNHTSVEAVAEFIAGRLGMFGIFGNERFDRPLRQVIDADHRISWVINNADKVDHFTRSRIEVARTHAEVRGANRTVSIAVPAQPLQVAHVTHTHSSTFDIWSLGFDTLFKHSYSTPAGTNIAHVLCLDHRSKLVKERWPFLQQVVYSGQSFFEKTLSCLDRIRPRPDFVFHTMEDMVLIGTARWELILGAIEMLRQAPEMNHFRFLHMDNPVCDDGPNSGNWEHTSWRRPGCKTVWPDVTADTRLSVCPLVASYGELRRLHSLGLASGGGGGDFEVAYNSVRPRPLQFLQGFVDPKYVTNSICIPDIHGECAINRYAYPAVHTAIATGAWHTDLFAPLICPYLKQRGLRTLAPCSCCGTKSQCGSTRAVNDCGRRTPDQLQLNGSCISRPVGVIMNKHVLYKDGCKSWNSLGRPSIPAVSARWLTVAAALPALLSDRTRQVQTRATSSML